MEQFKAGRVKQAIIKVTKPGTMRLKAMALAKKDLGISRTTPATSNKKLMGNDVKNFFGELKNEHIARAAVDGHAISGMTNKGFANTAYETTAPKTEDASAVEMANKHLEEKNQIKKDVGLQESAASARQHTVDDHNKPQIQKALDEVDLQKLENTNAGAEVHAVDKPAVGTMRLASGVNVAHRETPKTAVTAAPGVAGAQRVSGDIRPDLARALPHEPAPAPISEPTPQASASEHHAEPAPAPDVPVANDPFGS